MWKRVERLSDSLLCCEWAKWPEWKLMCEIEPVAVNADVPDTDILSLAGPTQLAFEMRTIRCSWNSVNAGYGGDTMSCCALFQWFKYAWLFIAGGSACARGGGSMYVGLGRLTPPISRMVFGSLDSSSISQMIKPRDGIATGWWIVLVIEPNWSDFNFLAIKKERSRVDTQHSQLYKWKTKEMKIDCRSLRNREAKNGLNHRTQNQYRRIWLLSIFNFALISKTVF